MSWARQASGGHKLVIKWGRGVRRQQSKDRQPRRPGADHIQGALRHAGRIAVHSKYEGGNRVKAVALEAFQNRSILLWLVEALMHTFQILYVDRFKSHEDPFATALGDQRNKFLVAQQIHADLRHPGNLGVARDDFPQERFGAPRIDGKIIVDEEDGNFPLLPLFELLEFQKLVDDARV